MALGITTTLPYAESEKMLMRPIPVAAKPYRSLGLAPTKYSISTVPAMNWNCAGKSSNCWPRTAAGSSTPRLCTIVPKKSSAK